MPFHSHKNFPKFPIFIIHTIISYFYNVNVKDWSRGSKNRIIIDEMKQCYCRRLINLARVRLVCIWSVWHCLPTPSIQVSASLAWHHQQTEERKVKACRLGTFQGVVIMLGMWYSAAGGVIIQSNQKKKRREKWSALSGLKEKYALNTPLSNIVLLFFHYFVTCLLQKMKVCNFLTFKNIALDRKWLLLVFNLSLCVWCQACNSSGQRIF